MTFPSSPPSAQSSIASGSEKSSSARSSRPQQSVWGTPSSQSALRRGLPPLATTTAPPSPSSAVSSRRPPQSTSPGPGSASSPLTTSFSAVLSSSSRQPGGRKPPSPASTPSSFSGSGPQQPNLHSQLQSGQSVSSPKSGPVASAPPLASTVGATAGGGSGGGGGGFASSRGSNFSPLTSGATVNSPTGVASDKPGGSSGQLSLAKISIAQVFLLLDSITEKEGTEKWETKVAQIRKLVESNGMEVFSKYFRRLLTGNASQIFPNMSRSGESSGNYPLLVQEMQKVSQDLEQAQKIAETVSTSEGDLFRDFDLSTFLDHFKLDPIVKVSLALAFKTTNKSDLRAKADAILTNSVSSFLHCLANPTESNRDFSPAFLRLTFERFIMMPPRNFNDHMKNSLLDAIELRYRNLGADDAGIRREVTWALQMFQLSNLVLVRQLSLRGSRATASQETVSEVLTLAGPEARNDEHVGNAVLFMMLSPQSPPFAIDVFLKSVQAHTDKSTDWPALFRAFDREGVDVTGEQFSRLYTALLSLEDPNLDIQRLWTGDWAHRDAQMSFLAAFIASRVDPSQLPNFREAFPADLFDDAPESVRAQAEQAKKSPLRSLDAAKAVFDLALFSEASWTYRDRFMSIMTALQQDLPVFLISTVSLPQPWTAMQQSFVLHKLFTFIVKREEGYQLAMHGIWKQDRQWLAEQLFTMFTQDPTSTAAIYDIAVENGWLDYLLSFTNGLALDLASLAHRKSDFDLEQWVRNAAQKGPMDMGSLLSKYLRIKAEDEMNVQRKEQPAPQMISLAVKTVYTLLTLLEEFVSDREILTPVQRICVQSYPRLINYGEGFDEIIDANGENGNAIPEAIDKKMQELFGKMYREELSLREILELMRRYKTSQDPTEQDLFTCMVHGLIDEYHCYHEYPLEALTKTAVMFGGIINFRLIDGIPLKVGLGMILEAVRDHEPHDPMYKFGVEAIEQLLGRLPEWVGFCHLLLQIPTLQGTTIAQKAQEVLREHQATGDADGGRLNGGAGGQSMANGGDDATGPRPFRSLHADPPLRPDLYRDADEHVQDRILFVLNNVSEQNIKEKVRDLTEVLRDEHHQWFAAYLVDQRAKLQPNFHQLYLDLLELIGDKMLWAEVVRETYVSAIRLLNAESTMTSSNERSHLKNLGSWLGLLTIAKDKPIKHKNIYFKELLVEGYETQRLMVVIPFTCKVLIQAAKSTVFKPPNPWLMDILSVLVELYHFAELKLNLKFEIEVLCKELELDHKAIEPSTIIRDRSQQTLGDGMAHGMAEGLETVEDMSLAGINQGMRTERLSPAAIMSTLPSLDKILVLPSSASSMIDPNVLRQIVHTAVERAIAEIITPVVERSITIASISTVQLITKDFAMEPDEEKVRHAARNMVRQLAGSLALVTCKEPLKMSMTNYIRMIQQEYTEQSMPEGLILMCVNDNLDAACGIVEKAAEERSIPEIEKVLEPQLEARRRHRATRPNEPYVDPSMSRWGLFIPEPYRHTPGGLNKEQLAIYEEFGRQTTTRPPATTHVQTASTDSGRQIPDVLQESFPAIPNLSTPADQPAVPHPTTQQQEGRLPQAGAVGGQPQMNGFLEAQTPQDKVESLISGLQQAARSASEEHIKDLGRDSPVLQEYNQVLRTILTSPNGEEMARWICVKICTALYSQTERQLEIEVLVHMLARICDMSPLVARYTWAILSELNEEHVSNVPVTVALIDAGLLDLRRVDMVLSKYIRQRNTNALELLSNLMDHVLFNDEPSALRSDFSGSLEAMNQWLVAEQNLPVANDIIRKLRESGVPEVVNPYLSDKAQAKRDQMEYIFSEWIGIYKFPGATDRTYVSFLKDVHNRQVMNNQEDSALFFRLGIDISVAMFEHESQNPNGSLDEAFLYIDALAKLVVLLVKFQGETAGSVRANKASYLDSILSLLVLVLNHHQVMRGEAFNQRVFFRLFSSILCEYNMCGLAQSDQHKDMMFAFANKFLSLQPKFVPGFVYGWLSLVSHRVFMSGMLNLPDCAGWGPYCEIMQALLSYMGEQLKPANVSYVAKDLYKGVLRILLILHHDFPEFVAENHFQFCNVIPAHCAQLRNLVLSAYPSSFHKLPDPFREGLKPERLDEMRDTPKIAGDIVAPLQRANIKSAVDAALQSGNASDSTIQSICDAIYNPATKETGLFMTPINVDVVLINALVLYIGQQAVSTASAKGNLRAVFEESSPHSTLLERLAKALRPEGRYYFLSAMANQLRYPNTHTYYFSFAILRLFGVDYSEQQDSDMRQQIIRVLLERLIVHRPHPWGLIITLQELLQNRSYAFFRLPFIQAAPEIGRLFDALLQHIQQQSPRTMS